MAALVEPHLPLEAVHVSLGHGGFQLADQQQTVLNHGVQLHLIWSAEDHALLVVFVDVDDLDIEAFFQNAGEGIAERGFRLQAPAGARGADGSVELLGLGHNFFMDLAKLFPRLRLKFAPLVVLLLPLAVLLIPFALLLLALSFSLESLRFALACLFLTITAQLVEHPIEPVLGLAVIGVAVTCGVQDEAAQRGIGTQQSGQLPLDRLFDLFSCHGISVSRPQQLIWTQSVV